MVTKLSAASLIVYSATMIAGLGFQQLKGDESNIVSKPFKISGSGTVTHIPLPTPDNPTPDPGIHTADGTATNLGKHSSIGYVQLDEFTSATTATFSSAHPVVFTGANGEQLAFDYAGIVTLTPALDEAGNPTGQFTSEWVADFTPVPDSSTGKYKNVVGSSFEMTARTGLFYVTDTDIPYSWDGEGTLQWLEEE